jgi:hypothetical protein
MRSTEVLRKRATEIPRTGTFDMKLEVVCIPVLDVSNSARAAMLRLALAAALVSAANFQARAQKLSPRLRPAHACSPVPVGMRTLAASVCIAGKAEAADLNRRLNRAPSIIGAPQ